MTAQLIKRFQIEGITTSDNLEHNQQNLYNTLVYRMNLDGFVPLLDIDPVWSWSWIEEEKYNFVYTWHGVFVGKDIAWETEGVSAGKRIPNIRKNKLQQSSDP